MFHSIIVLEAVYMLLLLCSWIAAMFSGIAFVYGIYVKKTKNIILPWMGVFAVCLVMVYLLMSGIIMTEAMVG